MYQYRTYKKAKHASAKPYRIFAALLVAVVMLVAGSVSFAWLNNGENVDMRKVSGSVDFAYPYFNGGDGTADSPYEIDNAQQFYNFAWLQYVGTFNEDLNKDGAVDQQVYFKLTSDIDMNGKVLPPIGTETNPFIGNFDGDGHTVSNVAFASTATDVPDLAAGYEGGDQIVGMFGVVGAKGDLTYTYNSEINKIANLKISSATIKSDTASALTGIAAGYVNGTLEDVIVADSAIDFNQASTALTGITSNVSDYTLVGYCTDAYREVADATTLTEYEPTVSEEKNIEIAGGDAWGGSINMKSLLNRIDDMHDNSDYVKYTQKIEYVSLEDGTTKTEITEGTNTNYKYYDGVNNMEGIASYSEAGVASWIKNLAGYSNVQVLMGKKDISYKKQIVTSKKIYEYTISDGSYFMIIDNGRVSSKPVTSLATLSVEESLESYSFEETTDEEVIDEIELSLSPLADEDDAAVNQWRFSNVTSGYLSTTVTLDDKGTDDPSDDETVTYYLNRNGSSLTVATAHNDEEKAAIEQSATQWVLDGSLETGGEIYCTAGTTTYYLVCSDTGVWRLSSVASTTFVIEDGEGNYLNINSSANGVENCTDRGQASSWVVQGGYIYTLVGGTRYYLRNSSGNLTVSSSNQTSWTVEDGDIYSGDYYLQFDGERWSLFNNPVRYYIYDRINGYYLCATSSGITSTESEKRATLWSGTSGSIYTTINGQQYYLAYSIGSLYVTTDNSSQFLVYKNWKQGSFTYNRKNYTGLYTSGFFGSYYLYCDADGNWSATNESSTRAGLRFDEYTDVPPFCALSPSEAVSAGCLVTYREEVATESVTIEQPTSYSTKDTVLPIITEDNTKEAADYNTGYIVSGANAASTLGGEGDIRVTESNISKISGSYSNGSFSSIYTIDGVGVHTIDNNNNNFEKYEKAKDSLLETLSGSSYVYGMHFMDPIVYDEHGVPNKDAAVSVNDLATIDKAVISGSSKSSYEVPRDSIDFNLKASGYINFFAGNYYFDYKGSLLDNDRIDNDSFFALYEIARDSEDRITQIKKISKIYSTTTDGEYVYQYEGETNTPSGAVDLLFDTAWIGKNTALTNNMNRLFYFEIPVNEGEYALGSVAGATGAYLLYLDIAAYSQIIDKTTTTEVTKIETTSGAYDYPKGVDVVSSGTTVAQAKAAGSNGHVTNSAAISLAAGSSTDVAISRSADGATVTISQRTGNAASYIKDGVTVMSGSNALVAGQNASAETTQTILQEVVTVSRYNEKTGSETKESTITTQITGQEAAAVHIDDDGTETAVDPEAITVPTGIALQYRFTLPGGATITSIDTVRNDIASTITAGISDKKYLIPSHTSTLTLSDGKKVEIARVFTVTNPDLDAMFPDEYDTPVTITVDAAKFEELVKTDTSAFGLYVDQVGTKYATSTINEIVAVRNAVIDTRAIG